MQWLKNSLWICCMHILLIIYWERGWLLSCSLPCCVTSRLLAFWLSPNGQCNHRDAKLTFFSGKIVKDSAFRDGRFIWPEGYTAVRKFTSVTGETFIVVVWGVDISYSFYWFFECSVIHVIFLILVILFFVVV